MGKNVLVALLCFLVATACRKDYVYYDYLDTSPILIVIYPIDGLGDRGYVDAVYDAVDRQSKRYGLRVQHVVPFDSLELRQYFKEVFQSTLPQQSKSLCLVMPRNADNLLKEFTPGYDNSKRDIVLFDVKDTYPNIHTLHISNYGMSYQAGMLAAQMPGIDKVLAVVANKELSTLKEGADGFTDGFTDGFGEANGSRLQVMYLGNQPHEGFNQEFDIYTQAFNFDKDGIDLVYPLCGGTVQGLLRYNRQHPSTSFYTVGIDSDMSSYSSRVPFSCVKRMDNVVSTLISQWQGKGIPDFQYFGLEGGYTQIVPSDLYAEQFATLLKETKRVATEAELKFFEYEDK